MRLLRGQHCKPDFSSPGKDSLFVDPLPIIFLNLVPTISGTSVPFKHFNSWPECSYHVPQPVQPEIGGI